MRDRDKIAIEEMAKVLCPKVLTEYCASGNCTNANCLVNAKALETLYNAGYRKQSEDEWISVDERLPDNDWGKHWKERKYYLVFTKPSGLMNVAVYGYKEHDWWIDMNSCVLDKKNYREVTHWMPLPDPPKDLENFEKKRLLAGDCFHGEIWYMCPYCFTGIEANSIPKDRICHKCGKEYL